MLLRVDVYPYDWKPPPPEAVQGDRASSLPPASATLYACLASASPSTDKEDGRILSVGRKTGDVLFSSDKSVSREHIVVRLASINKTHQQQPTPAKKKTRARAAARNDNTQSSVVSDDEEEAITRPLLATTPEQIQACQEDKDYHMCVLLENVGKLGTFVVLQDDSKDTGKKKSGNDGDSATGDDETDDEDQHPSQVSFTPAAAGVPLSTATQYLLPKGRSKSATLKPIALQETVVLNDLASRHGRVIVQCGKLGSTLVFSRHSIQVVRSGSKQGAAQWRAHDYQLGLVLDKENCFDEETNLMITPARNSSPKQLSAWCRNIPIVSNDYLQVLLWQRSSPQDPLFPNVASCAPRPDAYQFWTQVRPNPQLWSSCTLLSTKAKDDLEWLARSAGAKIVALYDGDYASLDTQALIAALEQRHGILPDQVSKACFGIAASRQSKLTKHLLEAFPELPMIPANQVAKCITEQRLLQDSDGNVIGMVVEAAAEKQTESNSARQEKQPDTAAAQGSTTSQRAAKETAKTTKQSLQDDTGKQFGPGEETQAPMPPGPDQDDVAQESPPSNRETTASQSKEQAPVESSRKRRAEPSQEDEEPRKKRAASPQQDESRKERAASPNEESREKQAAPSQADQSRKKRSAPSQDEDVIPSKRQKLVASKDRPGWLQAAPHNAKERRAFKKTREEIIEATGHDELYDVAVTEESDGLVVVATTSSTAVSSNQQKRKRSGPDFRKFRKNSVAAAATISPIVMRSVLPKETEDQLHFEEQQHALEEQRRRADELFRDPGPRSAGGRARGRRR